MDTIFTFLSHKPLKTILESFAAHVFVWYLKCKIKAFVNINCIHNNISCNVHLLDKNKSYWLMLRSIYSFMDLRKVILTTYKSNCYKKKLLFKKDEDRLYSLTFTLGIKSLIYSFGRLFSLNGILKESSFSTYYRYFCYNCKEFRWSQVFVGELKFEIPSAPL